VPAANVDPLWSDRVLFMSKLGQDVKVVLGQMRAKDPSVQAKAWISLAASSALPADQLEALTTAVGILEGMFAQATARVELGEWLYLNRFPTQVRVCLCVIVKFDLPLVCCGLGSCAALCERNPCAMALVDPSHHQDAMDQLHAAADILLEVLHPLAEADVPDGPAGDGGTFVSRAMSRGSGGGRSGASKSSRGTGRGGGVAKSVASQSTRSKPASTVAPPGSVSSKTLKTMASGIGGALLAAIRSRSGLHSYAHSLRFIVLTHSSTRATALLFSKLYPYRPTYRPTCLSVAILLVAKAVVHAHFACRLPGLEQHAPVSDWPTRLEISHFELLVRIMTTMAKMAGSAPERTQYLLTAVHFVNTMWGLTMHTLNTAAAERVSRAN
jgi:hypothetical protein